jgi:hypothetical protein
MLAAAGVAFKCSNAGYQLVWHQHFYQTSTFQSTLKLAYNYAFLKLFLIFFTLTVLNLCPFGTFTNFDVKSGMKNKLKLIFYIFLKCLKGTVQWKLRGVKIGISRSIMMYSLAGKCPLPCPNGHRHESIINVSSSFSTFLRHPNLLGQKTQQRKTNLITASELQHCS